MYSIYLALIGIFLTFWGSMCPLFPKMSELSKALSGWGGGSKEEQALLDTKYKKMSKYARYCYVIGSIFQIAALLTAYKGV